MLGSGMSERQFLEASAKQRAASAVRAVEAQTAVEVVVAVRRRASHYVWTSVAFGAACGAAGFAYMWFSEQIYDVLTMPLDTAIAWSREHGGSSMVLDTVEEMTSAIRFYEAHGFTRDDRQIRGSRCTRGYIRPL